jgi:hypothetical protein
MTVCRSPSVALSGKTTRRQIGGRMKHNCTLNWIVFSAGVAGFPLRVAVMMCFSQIRFLLPGHHAGAVKVTVQPA